MPNSWVNALRDYSYQVDLTSYERRNEFPDFFEITLAGDRQSTIEFENRFRDQANETIPVYLEVIYWKLFSQPHRRNTETSRRSDFLLQNEIMPQQLSNALRRFIENMTVDNLQSIRCLLCIRTDVFAVPLTFTAFLDPENIPMIDNQVAKWVNQNMENHNVGRQNLLTPFHMNYTSLRDNDFPNYLNWVSWCREIASILYERTDQHWRARDVEMAVFTAKRSNLILNVLD